jgi:hypothetical protein
MQRFIYALIMGLFSGPGSGPATAPAQGATAQVPLRPPVSAADAARARAAVRHIQEAAAEDMRSHRFEFPDGTAVEFRDRPKRPRDQAQRERVVAHVGTERAASEPDSTFEAAGRAAGLSPEAITALRFVSRHEGGFDAINTWDRARFSWGFIQFAGGYGFPPALLHFKERSPALFQKLLADYGVDVLRDSAGRPEPIYLDPVTGNLLRGKDAEQAFGDNPLVIALFIRAGSVTEVKQRQVEAAIRDYAAPALTAIYGPVKLCDVLRSPQGLAMLIDRQVHEGNVSRLEWALEHATILNNASNPADWRRLEGQVMELAIQDADARASIAEMSEAAAAGLERAAAKSRAGEAAWVPDGPTLTGALDALRQAIYQADQRMVVSYRRDELRAGLTTALTTLDPEQVRGMPASTMAVELERQAAGIREQVSRYRFEYAIRNRLRNIRASELAGPAR